MKYLFVFLLLGLVGCGDDAKNETAKQPSCKDVKGLQIADVDLVPKDYTGVAFKCFVGKVKWRYNYKDGKYDGLSRGWHDNGQLWYEKNYKDGKLDGLCRRWYKNGQLWYEKNYKDHKLDGLRRDWHKNGQLEAEYNYKDGKRISAKCFDEDGNLIKCD